MDLWQEKKRRDDFLVTLLEMHAGNYGGDRPTKELCKTIGLDYDTDCSIVGQYLYKKGFVQWSSFDWISLTTSGIEEAERIVESRYAVKAQRVLKKIYDMSKGLPGEILGFDFLVKELGMTDDEVSRICTGLEQEGYIDWPGGDVLEMTALGAQAIESSGEKRFGGDTYNTNIGTIHGAAQIGSGNVQNVQINVSNNPEFDQAIAGLLQIVQASGLTNDEVEELKDEVTKLNKLALSEPEPGSLEKAKFRIDKAKLSFEAAKLLVQAAPHLHTAWEYLKIHFG